ncbi:uncharacterized protein [Lolium perenne]|uniref:uncharacterized protein n=1 Tax=Lolium perenne TaxID=4522 RepID=UPI003A9A5FBA
MRPSSGALGQDEAVVLQFVTHLQGPAELSFPRLATGRRRPAGAGATLPQSSTTANRKGGGEMKKERVAPLSWPPRHDELRHGRPFFPFGVLLVDNVPGLIFDYLDDDSYIPTRMQISWQF